MRHLAGKVALITGGSRGIGMAVAAALADAGARIVIGARDAREIDQTCNRLRAGGAEVSGSPVDVADVAAVNRWVEEAVAACGRIDILVNAAAVQGPIGPLWKIEMMAWRATVETNLMGTMHCCRAALPHMIAAGRGKVINFSGGGATGPRPNFSAYAASKAAVVRLTETLAEELLPFGIDVNAIAPGIVNTRMLDAIVEAGTDAGAEYDAISTLRDGTGGFVEAELPAELAVFLASSEADGLTGRLISAPHDGWRSWDKDRIDRLAKSPWLTLRRIDRNTLRSLGVNVAEECDGKRRQR